jgi:DegV family protein with EDD domain
MATSGRRIRIVTDSSAHFLDPSVIERYQITVLPLSFRLDGQVYREDRPADVERFMAALREGGPAPEILSPSADEIAEVYARLNRETDRILSLHISREIHGLWNIARTAADRLLGRCDIRVVDSGTMAVGLALLVEAAARYAETTYSLDDVVRLIRKLIPRLYAVFNVPNLNYLRRAALMGYAQTVLGEMLGIRPFVTIEEGRLVAMEKVTSDLGTVDKLVEFVTEFAMVEHIVILQDKTEPNPLAAQLVERLQLEFADRNYPVIPYKASTACVFGPGALGVMVFEAEFGKDA